MLSACLRSSLELENTGLFIFVPFFILGLCGLARSSLDSRAPRRGATLRGFGVDG